MIQVNELRLGNVIGLRHPDHQKHLVEMVVDMNVLNLLSGYVPTPDNMIGISYEPIPLTEDILLKCGFKGSAETILTKEDIASIYLIKPYVESQHYLVKAISGDKIT